MEKLSYTILVQQTLDIKLVDGNDEVCYKKDLVSL